MKHVVLLNPPGRFLYLREYFCGKISKADYLVHPVDLLWLSAQLDARYRVTIVDAIAERLTPAAALDRLRALAPDALVFLSSSVSESEDLEFLRLARPFVSGELIAIGDNFLKNPEKSLADHPEIDAILLGFFAPTLADYLNGERGDSLRDLYFRAGGETVRAANDTSRGTFAIGLPRHDQLDLSRYAFPFARRRPYGTLLTDYGCPFDCTFCLIGKLPYRTRELDDVFGEVAYLKSLGVRDLYIDDQTFMPSRKRLDAFCEGLAKMRLGIGWTCYVRADLSDPDRLKTMKAAGCHTAIVGVESGSDVILSRYGKDVTTDQIRTAVTRVKAAGLTAVGTFIVGLPGETEQTCRETIDFALSLSLDFASFNTPIPRAYTEMRDEVLAEGWGDDASERLDQSGSAAAVNTPTLSARAAFAFRNEAERRFYLRPGYLLRRVLGIRSPFQAVLMFREGLSLIRRVLAARNGGRRP